MSGPARYPIPGRGNHAGGNYGQSTVIQSSALQADDSSTGWSREPMGYADNELHQLPGFSEETEQSFRMENADDAILSIRDGEQTPIRNSTSNSPVLNVLPTDALVELKEAPQAPAVDVAVALHSPDAAASLRLPNTFLQKEANPVTHDRPLVCGRCGNPFKNNRNLRRHQSEVHGSREFFCPNPACDRSTPGKGFNRKERLKNHKCRADVSIAGSASAATYSQYTQMGGYPQVVATQPPTEARLLDPQANNVDELAVGWRHLLDDSNGREGALEHMRTAELKLKSRIVELEYRVGMFIGEEREQMEQEQLRCYRSRDVLLLEIARLGAPP